MKKKKKKLGVVQIFLKEKNSKWKKHWNENKVVGTIKISDIQTISNTKAFCE